MMYKALLVLSFIISESLSFAISPFGPIGPFNEWHCIDFIKNIDTSKPYSYNVGELPLVSWFDKNKSSHTTVNICKHMGSKLDKGKISNTGCLICPYHGLKHDKNSTFGTTVVFQDKLWWSYEPKTGSPPSTPLFNNKNYATSYIKVDIDANILDCVYNFMDLNHAGYVYNNVFGFGSNIPAKNIDTKQFNANKMNKLGLSFTYKSGTKLKHLKSDIQISKKL